MKTILVVLCLILVASTGALGWLYFQQVNLTNDVETSSAREAIQAATEIKGLQDTVTALQGQLASEQANSTSLNAQLEAETTKSAGLTSQIASLSGDSTTVNSRLIQAQNDLAASKTTVAGLQNDLAAAQAKATSLQTSLDKTAADLAKANQDLTKTNADLSNANASLKKVQDPRHFNNVAELADWLAKDDTDTNSKYAGLTMSEKAFVLQVKALRDGLLLPVGLDADGENIYSWNSAVINGTIYVVNASDDSITMIATFVNPLASHPLPLP